MYRRTGIVSMIAVSLSEFWGQTITVACKWESIGPCTGDLAKVHGDKVNNGKNSTDDQTFKVEKLNKDCGPCTANPWHLAAC